MSPCSRHAPEGTRRRWLGASGSGRWRHAAYGGLVLETTNDLSALQDLLDRSLAASGEHLRSAFDQSKRLTADQLATALGGIFELHLAVVSGSGAPLVAPLDGIFFRGKVWIGIPAKAVRSRLIRRDARVSASYNAPQVAMIVHGVAQEPEPNDPMVEGFSALARDLYVQIYGAGWLEWFEVTRAESVGRDFTGYIEPRAMFAKGAFAGGRGHAGP